MSLASLAKTLAPYSFPRVSGDEPAARPKPLDAHVFSPRERG